MLQIYGRMSCPFCVKAVTLCEEQGVNYAFHPVNTQIRDIAANLGHTTVPMVFENKKLIGGYTELHAKLTKHNTWDKIKWWIVTGYHFFHCKQTYRRRIGARAACILNNTPQYLSGKGKK